MGRGVACLLRQSATSKHSVHFHCGVPLPVPALLCAPASSSRQVTASDAQGGLLTAQARQPAGVVSAACVIMSLCPSQTLGNFV